MPIPKVRSVNPNCSQKLKPSSAKVVNPQNTIGNPETIRMIPKITPLRFIVLIFSYQYEIKGVVIYQIQKYAHTKSLD